MSDISRGYAYGLRQVILQSADGLKEAELPAARTFSYSEITVNDELDGSDKTVATVSFPKKLEWELENGGISLAVLEILTGEEVTVSGATPNQIEEMVRHAGTSAPYFKVLGRSVGDKGDAVYVIVPNAKITALEGNFEQETFTVTKCSGDAIDEGAGLYIIRKLQTDAPLPTA